MNKVYALYHNKQKLEMKITNEKHWEKQGEQVEESKKAVLYWNENFFLSFSRSALVEKANQIKQEWLQEQYNNISKIASIDIRR